MFKIFEWLQIFLCNTELLLEDFAVTFLYIFEGLLKLLLLVLLEAFLKVFLQL